MDGFLCCLTFVVHLLLQVYHTLQLVVVPGLRLLQQRLEPSVVLLREGLLHLSSSVAEPGYTPSTRGGCAGAGRSGTCSMRSLTFCFSLAMRSSPAARSAATRASHFLYFQQAVFNNNVFNNKWSSSEVLSVCAV